MTEATIADELWIRRFHPSPDATARLVCFPHVGGAATFFFPMSAALAPETEVLAIQYPGRQDRLGEPAVTDIHELAGQIAAALSGSTDRPLALFGHSMGALVAFETARLLQARGGAPTALFASARRPPQLSDDALLHRHPDDELVRELKKLGGTDLGLLDDPAMLRMVMPAIRADYRAVETYRYRPDVALSCPIVAITGDNDPLVGIADIDGWRQHTSAAYEALVLPGDHFYLGQQQTAVLDMIAGHLGPQRVRR